MILSQIEPPTQGALITAVAVLWSTLAAAVVGVWRFVVRELRECKRDRNKLWETLARNGICEPEPEND